MKEKKVVNGNVCILIAAVLWSFGGAFTKLIPWGPLSIACLRALIAAGVLAIYRRTFRFSLTKSNIIGSIAMFFTTLCFICANKYTTAANAIVLQYTMPIYVILFNIIFRRERPKGLDIAAVALTFVGIAVFFIDSMGAGTMLGNVLALGAGLCFAVVFFVSSDKDATPIEINYIGNLMYIFLIPFLFVDRQLVFTPASVASILFLGIVQLGIAYIFFSKGIQNTSAISASLISAVEPILNPVWAMIIIGEKPSLLSVLAGIFVVIVIAAYNIIKAKTEQNEMQKGNV